jgi:signal transduction histidine kinase
MKSHSVKFHLFLTILILTIVPFVASFVFMNDTLDAALRLGFNPAIPNLISDSQTSLKRLKDVDPANENLYRERFQRAEELKHIYEDRELLISNIDGPLNAYFGLGLIAALALSFGAALWLSRRIARSYEAVFNEMTLGRERVRFLEDISAWQETARFLAHEIKNPLTPIEMAFANLERAFATSSTDAFKVQLTNSRQMAQEELAHLKALVAKFSEFAKTPQPTFESMSVFSLSEQYIATHGQAWENVTIELYEGTEARAARAKIDRSLLRQVFNNLILNAVEANPSRDVSIKFYLEISTSQISLRIANSGDRIPEEIVAKIFQPSFSTKTGARNSGLGLAIVKKIILEHAGEIFYEEWDGWPSFVIRLPQVTEA